MTYDELEGIHSRLEAAHKRAKGELRRQHRANAVARAELDRAARREVALRKSLNDLVKALYVPEGYPTEEGTPVLMTDGGRAYINAVRELSGG